MFEGSIGMSYHAKDFSVFGVSKHRTHFRAPPAFSLKPSSALLHTDGTGSLSESSYFPSGSVSSRLPLRVANTIGVLGGASPVSTINFLQKLVKWSSGDGQESLPFIACNDPTLNKEFSSCQSSPPYLSSKTYTFKCNKSLIIENLRHKRIFLESSGARCIVMPCHLSHVWHAEVSKDCSVPFLDAGECVAKELKAANLKPIEAGSNLRIGILATEAILTAGYYQEQLQNQGFEVILPDRATMEHAVIPSMRAFERKDMEGARNLLRIALQVLLVRAVNTVILASDEMLGLLPPDDPLLKKCTNPMDALVRSTADWAKSKEIANQHSNEMR